MATGDPQYFCQMCNKMYYHPCTIHEYKGWSWNPYWTTMTTYQPESNNLELLINELKPALDRTWEDETPAQIIAITINALYWRDREIKNLKDKLEQIEKLSKYESTE